MEKRGHFQFQILKMSPIIWDWESDGIGNNESTLENPHSKYPIYLEPGVQLPNRFPTFRQVQKSASRLLLAGGTHSAVELTDHGAPLEAFGFRSHLMTAVFGVCLVKLQGCLKMRAHICHGALRSSHRLPRFWLLGMGPSSNRDR